MTEGVPNFLPLPPTFKYFLQTFKFDSQKVFTIANQKLLQNFFKLCFVKRLEKGRRIGKVAW